MHLPSILYGTYATSLREVRKTMTQVRRGVSWNDAMQATGEVDTADHTGLLLLNGPNPLLGGDEHFHLFLPLTEFARRVRSGQIPRERGDEVFAECLLTLDGLLGLLAPANLDWVYPEQRRQLVLNAVIQQWDVLDGVGERYSIGMATGSRLWAIPMNLKFILANMGVDASSLNAPLPQGGLPGLIATLPPTATPV